MWNSKLKQYLDWASGRRLQILHVMNLVVGPSKTTKLIGGLLAGPGAIRALSLHQHIRKTAKQSSAVRDQITIFLFLG